MQSLASFILLQSARSERSGRHTPLHAVSPAQSTKVPTAPATTPATHGLGVAHEGRIQGNHRDVGCTPPRQGGNHVTDTGHPSPDKLTTLNVTRAYR